MNKISDQLADQKGSEALQKIMDAGHVAGVDLTDALHEIGRSLAAHIAKAIVLPLLFRIGLAAFVIGVVVGALLP